jgi:hypothetical protein
MEWYKVNPGEVSQASSHKNKRKLLSRLDQTVRGQVRRLRTPPAQMSSHRRSRHDLTHSDRSAERGNPVVFPASHTNEEGTASRKSGPRDSGGRIREQAKAAL